jgi:hypothetical protein
MTKYIHSVKAEKFSSDRKIFKSKTYKCSSLGPTTNMGHVSWLYGKWNYEQCFPTGNEGRKSYPKQRVDIIIYIRGDFWPVFFFGAKFRQLTDQNKKPSAISTNYFFKKIFKNIAIFLRKIYKIRQISTVSSCSSPRFMQDSEKTLLSGSRHLMRIKAGDPRQCTYLKNLDKKNPGSD